MALILARGSMATQLLPTPTGDVLFLTALRPDATLAHLRNIPGAPRIGALLYGALRKQRSMRAAAVVFCDVERLGPEQEDHLAALAARWTGGENVPILLNTPPKALRRYPLMKALKAAGVNRADVARLDDPDALARIRFPCFIRYENGHIDKGRSPELLVDQGALAAKLAAMRANGETFYGKIAIEYEDVRDAAGYYVKYSYFKVGDALIAGHRFADQHWFVKAASQQLVANRPEVTAAEREYVETSPYRDQIQRVFEIAGIDYGRIDFGVRNDGGLQIFEINTNPRHPSMQETIPARIPIVSAVKARIASAFAKLIDGRVRVTLRWNKSDV